MKNADFLSVILNRNISRAIDLVITSLYYNKTTTWKKNVTMVFWKEKNRVPRRNGATTSKGFFPPIYASSLLWLLLFFFFISLSIKYSVTGQCGGRKIPSVGRAFYDSHGVFRSLYPFLTTPVHRYNPCTLNPCIIVRNYMVEDKCYLKKEKKNHNTTNVAKSNSQTRVYHIILLRIISIRPWDYFLKRRYVRGRYIARSDNIAFAIHLQRNPPFDWQQLFH